MLQPQIINPTPKKSLKVCPECDYNFGRAKTIWSSDFHKDVKVCPRCFVPIFYRKLNSGSKTKVVLYEDKVLVDQIIAKVNQNLRKLSGFYFDEATVRERKFAWDLLEWAPQFLDGCENDLGLTCNEFLLGLIDHILANDWWSMHLTSLLMISNQKQHLAWDFWESEARKRRVETPRAAATKKRINELARSLEV
jgi:hypothetical protein